MNELKYLLFDWGDTLMVDYPQYDGSMAYWEKVSPMPGVIEIMPILSTYYKCIVASNAGDSDAELMKKAFGRIALDQYFSEFITSKELGATKPSPDFFQGIVSMFGLTLYEVAMIGNDYEKDITGAKNIGLNTIFITNEKGDFPYADYIISSFEKLIDVLEIPAL
jgi:putative hydrolase of the HAD superfamily